MEHTMVDCVIEMRSRLYGWRAERDLQILKRRGDGFLRGRHAFRISDAGITVFPRFEALLAIDKGAFDLGERFTRTASDGSYALLDLPAGTYQIRSVIGSDFAQSSPANRAA